MKNSVVVNVYDGKDKNATTVDISDILYADALFANNTLEAPFVTSTKCSLLISIQVYTGPLAKKVKDFQGMVTDVQNPAECGRLLLSNNVANLWYSTISTSNGSSCLKKWMIRQKTMDFIITQGCMDTLFVWVRENGTISHR